MKTESIMVSGDTTAEAIARFRLASNLSEQLGARLIGVAARNVDIPVAADATMSAYWFPEVEKEALRDLENVESSFKDVTSGSNRADWRSSLSPPLFYLAAQSRAADLVVVGRSAPQDALDPKMGVRASDFVMIAGRPILMVPPHLRQMTAKRILVAWKDTRESRRAVFDAMGFLKRAEQVLVVQVTDDPVDSHVKDVVEYLQCHSVQAEGKTVAENGLTTGQALAERAAEFGADMIVSGAYGHSRFSEAVFGGVTRSLLNESEICCFLSH